MRDGITAVRADKIRLLIGDDWKCAIFNQLHVIIVGICSLKKKYMEYIRIRTRFLLSYIYNYFEIMFIV